MDDRTRRQSITLTGSISRRAALGHLAGGGVAAALLTTIRWDNGQANAQATPGLRREEPNHFELADAEMQITYTLATEDRVPRLTYQGPAGSRTFVGDDVLTQESALGRLVTVYLGAFPDQGDLWLTLLLPTFIPMTIWDAPIPVTTLAIEKWLVSTIAGPPREGALEGYKVATLEGTAQFVTTLPQGVTAEELSVATRLLSGHNLPPTVDTVALTRVTVPPGAEVTAVNGAHLFVVETGALTVRELMRIDNPAQGTPGPVYVEVPGGPSDYTVGDQLLVSHVDTTPLTITNDGTEPVVALVVSLAVTSGGSIGDSLTGGAVVEPLAVADAAQVGPPLLGAVAERISVALVRVNYEPGASVDILDILEPAVSLLAVEAGALNVLVADPALFTPAGGAPKQLPSDTWVALAPGDQLLLPAPGRIATRNEARGPSAVLIVMIGTVPG